MKLVISIFARACEASPTGESSAGCSMQSFFALQVNSQAARALGYVLGPRPITPDDEPLIDQSSLAQTRVS